MIKGIKIHLQAIKVALAARMAYRGDFFISLIIMLLFEFLAPIITFLIYNNGATFPEWSFHQALLIQAVFLLSRGIAFPFFFGMVWNTVGMVKQGTFDLMLIKPWSTLHLTIMNGFDSEDLGKLAGGIILFTYSISKLPTPTFSQWMNFILLFIFSLVVMFAFAIIMAASVIKWVGNGRVYDIFFSLTAFGQYPLAIFSKGIQTFITVIIPISLLGFFPAATLLGKQTSFSYLAMGSSVVFLFIGMVFWKYMLNQYTSAGG